MINIKEFIVKNQKYLIFLGIGFILLLFSSSFSSTKPNDASLEKQFETILESVDGIGDISVMISRNKEKQAEGVIVVAKDAENAMVKKIITDAAVAILDVKPHKVQIFTQKK